MNKFINILTYSILIVLIFLQIHISAQDFQKIATTGFVFLELPVTARSVAMGETGITMTNAAAEGLFTNPALISLAPQRMSANVSYADWYVETTHQALGFIYAIPQFGTIGFQAIHFDFGEMEKTINPSREQTGSYISLGTYSAGAYAIGISYARSLTDKFSFGSSLKYVRESIDVYHAENVVADIGFLYQTGFNSLRIGAFLQNFGLEAKYAQEKFKMPQQLRLGISGEVWGSMASPNHLTLLAEAVHPNDADERIHLGLEAMISNAIVLRAGYKFGYDEENLCLGGGLRFAVADKRFGFDVGYMNHEFLDMSLRYSLVVEF